MPEMVRITPAAHQSLVAIARARNSSLQQVLEHAIEQERRRLLLENTNTQYAKIRGNKKAWRAWRRELQQLDSTLADGI